MTSTLGIKDGSGWTIFIFGLLALLFGLVGLLRPELLLTTLGFTVLDRASRATGDYTLVYVIASSMAAVNVGAYYILASLNDMKQFYKWTVPFRCLTFLVFGIAILQGLAPIRFIGVGLWELAGALATGWALSRESKSRRSI